MPIEFASGMKVWMDRWNDSPLGNHKEMEA